MACIDNENKGRNYILETVKSIDKMQKDIIIERFGDCVSCETSLISISYNTVPVSFYMCNGSLFQAKQSFISSDLANVFRIESIRDNRFVILRLIVEGDTPSCLDQTVVLDLECVCGIECYGAINCPTCSQEN